jgi:hypothetical protein
MLWDSPNNRQYTLGTSVIVGKEVLGGDQGFDTLEEGTISALPAKMPPQHFDGIEPGTVGRQIQ